MLPEKLGVACDSELLETISFYNKHLMSHIRGKRLSPMNFVHCIEPGGNLDTYPINTRFF
jgi:hypothetical protein